MQPSLVLSVEEEELGITAGLQDRVIQIYEGLVYMDFAKEQVQLRCGLEHGIYESLDPTLLPPIYVAYSGDLGEPTEVFHNDIRGRYQRGDKVVVSAMQRCADLAVAAREAILDQEPDRLHELIDENFNVRRSIYQLPPGQVRMVEVARSVGASAKFAGSGGAIVGTYKDRQGLTTLREKLYAIGCHVITPKEN